MSPVMPVNDTIDHDSIIAMLGPELQPVINNGVNECGNQCKLGNKCMLEHWYVEEDEGEQYKSCDGECLEISEKCNGKCEHYQCEMNDGSCMISDLPERVWRDCNGKCIRTSSKCDGVCGSVFFPQCETTDGTCTDLIDEILNSEKKLMFGICAGNCTELITWNSTASCNGKCDDLGYFDTTLGRKISL
jgi:hypothetical protein